MQSSAPSTTTKTPSTFFFLNVLRAYASCTIVLFHAYSISQHFYDTHNMPPPWWYGVIDLFFVMSGFLMVHMSRKLYGAPNGMFIFFCKRAIRTPPLYWIYTALVILIFYTMPYLDKDHRLTWETVIASFTFFPTVGKPIILLGWTLNLEIFFYTLFAFSLLFPFPRGAILLCAALASLVAIGKVFALPFYALQFWTDPLLIDFIWGMALAVLYHHKNVRLSLVQRYILLTIGCAVILGTPASFNYGNMTRPFTFGLGSALLVAAATLREYEPDLGRTGKVITEISSSAYSLYLTHVLSLKIVEFGFLILGIYNPLAYILTGIPFAIIVAYIAYLLVEKPLTEYLRTRIPHA